MIVQKNMELRDFLKKHTTIIELKNGTSALVLAPEWQGRIMTSTTEGDIGFSFGWIHRALIESGKLLPHINAFGGEERLWLSKGKSFTYDNWQTPAFIDSNPFQLIASTD